MMTVSLDDEDDDETSCTLAGLFRFVLHFLDTELCFASHSLADLFFSSPLSHFSPIPLDCITTKSMRTRTTQNALPREVRLSSSSQKNSEQ